MTSTLTAPTPFDTMRAAISAPTNRALIAVVGPSGSGKSSSLEGLDPTTTRIIDLERKGMPWRGPKHHVRAAETLEEFDKLFDEAVKDPAINLIVIDSFTAFCVLTKRDCQKKYTGWDIWGNYAKNIWLKLSKTKNKKCSVVWTAIDEVVKVPKHDGTEAAKRQIAVDGKELGRDGGVDREFLIIFYTDARPDKTGKIQYTFMTNTDGMTTAKSPKGMFNGPIPNDLAAALKTAKEYYGGEGQVEI